jgi:hypothetical protein
MHTVHIPSNGRASSRAGIDPTRWTHRPRPPEEPTSAIDSEAGLSSIDAFVLCALVLAAVALAAQPIAAGIQRVGTTISGLIP